MTPLASQTLLDVATEHHLDPTQVIGNRQSSAHIHARVEMTKRLRDAGYSFRRIAQIINRDHTTVSRYLGRIKKKPVRPLKWHRPNIAFLSRCPMVDEPPKPPKSAKSYLRPYAGADVEYVWKEIV